MKKHIVAAIILLFLFPLWSNIIELTGSLGTTAPLSQMVLGEGSGVAYHNPSLLFNAKNGFTMGFQTLGKLLYIDYGDRTAGADISDKIYNAMVLNNDGSTGVLQRKPLATKDLAKRGGVSPKGYDMFISIGLAKEIVPKYWSLGMHMMIPTNSFQKQSPFYPDEREQYFTNSLHFEMLGDAVQSSRFGFGTAVQFFPQMQFGLGFTVGSKSVAKNTVFMPESGAHESAFVSTDLTVNNFVVPYFAISGRPLEKWLITVTLHLKAVSTVNTENKIRFWGEDVESTKSEYSVTYARDFDPLTLGFGSAYDFSLAENWSMNVGAGAKWHYWGNYRNRQNVEIERKLNNSWTAMLGAVVKWRDTAFSLDGRFVQTPVPDQTGRTNYVDSNRLAFALGLTQSFKTGPVVIGFGIDFQAHHYFHRSVQKDPAANNPVVDEFPDSVDIKTDEEIEESKGFQTNNPGWPGFSSGGWMLSGGVTISVYF